MCHSLMITYTCECVKEMEFVQCDEAKAARANIKCKPVTKSLTKMSVNYCKGHLVNRTAPKKYYSDSE